MVVVMMIMLIMHMTIKMMVVAMMTMRRRCNSSIYDIMDTCV